MANRRMFSKTIIASARFLRMPPTSRLLYYDLGMYADDDGIVEAFSVMRMTQATDDDLKVLMAKGFVKVLNDEQVTLIVDWNENNYIPKDRYHPSIYKGLVLQLTDGACIQPVDNLETEVRLGKDRIGKGKPKKEKTVVENDGFDLFWKAYPRHVAKQNAVRAFAKLNPDTKLLDVILKDIEKRKETEAWKKDGGQFVPHPATYLNGRRWEDDMPTSSPPKNTGKKLSKIDWGDDD